MISKMYRTMKKKIIKTINKISNYNKTKEMNH